ncbi:hypothetical protein Q0M94_28300 (plasmid) [Deinococcus radiomollis]|uniref:hypothetical protein n=1 Tax=Deinococcus radiomollis TaxID=468916 RepID=UPI0038916574
MPFGRNTQTYTVGIKFVADEASTMLIASGATVDLTSFTSANYGNPGQRYIPAGTAVSIVNGLAVNYTGTGTAYLMASDIVENPLFPRGSDLTTGLYAGGVFFEDRLPDAVAGSLPAAIKTGLGSNFVFQSSPGALVVGN